MKWSALAFAIEWAPRLIFLPVAGHIADTISVNKLYIIADGVRTAAVALSCFMISWQPTWSFFVLSIMMATLSLFQSLAFVGIESTLPRQLPPEEIPKTQSLLQVSDQVSQVLGPAIAGLLVSFVDLRFIMALGALLFACSLVNSLTLPRFAKMDGEKIPLAQVFIKSYATGLRIISEHTILIQLITLTWIVNILYGSILILAPALTTQFFGKPAHFHGFMMTTSAILCISAMSLAPQIVKKFDLPKLGAVALSLMCGGAALGSVASSWVVFAAGAISILIGDGLFNVYIRSLRAKIIPKSQFGKVTGTIILINNSSLPASGIVVSHLAQYLNQHQILIVMSISAATLFGLVLLVGKIKFRYPTFLPNVILAKG